MNNGHTADYNEIIKSITEQIYSRKGLILKRVFFVLWPWLILAVVLLLSIFVLPGIVDNNDSISNSLYLLTYALYFSFAFFTLWVIITGYILNIEIKIWTLSFFDQKRLSPDLSWKISKKLFFPMLRLDTALFIRYGLFPLAVFIGLIYLIINSNPPLNYDRAHYVIIGIAVLSAMLFIYTYLISFRLRYISYIFFELYGLPNYSTREVISQASIFNQRSKGADIKKIIKLQFGADALESAISSLSATLMAALSTASSSSGGRFLRGAMTWYTAGIEATAKSYALTISYYVIYRELRKSIFNNSSSISKVIYDLVD